ncbi:ankyrin repeat protein [Caulobacter ginsengisoli]|uniref:Ankyrin repeat protein n=1 Tax=Caulobacter ginsengisoli TaxID=400775 RepID=A0ABU0IMU1_9CAUL|nr:ankyrin repeat domain-containing protein [Caulobacter ginsengisoli]MDQ0463329.1 ankyrin repeat protein [Caulobacter ginsengisoli]
MNSSQDAPRPLPGRASQEFLRKEAKRRARASGLGLARAQRDLAAEYGAQSWAELMRRIAQRREEDGPPGPLSPLALAARIGAADEVRRLLAQGAAPNGETGDLGTPLWHACAGEAADDRRLETARLLLEAGADPKRDTAGAPSLHAAATRGPAALVELLIRHGALEWQPDHRGRSPLAAARRGSGPDRSAIVTLLDRPVVQDRTFRKAIAAIHAGDIARLGALLDAEPWLLRERIVEPDCYRQAARQQYFLDPKLFWFIANNPRLAPALPANIVEIAQAMIARGVDKSDLTYALELVMTGASVREQGQQLPLMRVLLEAGAEPSASGVDMSLAHGELEAVGALVAAGAPLTASIAAATGQAEALKTLLSKASAADLQMALALAVINGQTDAARTALEAGADPNRFMPVHAHSLPLHQAALSENIDLLALLVAYGARTDIPDKLWSGTPLDWAVHENRPVARAWLEALGSKEA